MVVPGKQCYDVVNKAQEGQEVSVRTTQIGVADLLEISEEKWNE